VSAVLGVANPTWHDEAACRGSVHDWIPDPGAAGYMGRELTVQAATCDRCPVLALCEAEVAPRPTTEQHGIWGGWLWRGPGKTPLDLLHACGLRGELRPTPRAGAS
jgi:hypothetical protein